VFIIVKVMLAGCMCSLSMMTVDCPIGKVALYTQRRVRVRAVIDRYAM